MTAISPKSGAIQQATRVGLGREILPGVSGSSQMGRRLREIVGALTADMGGESEMTEAKMHICRRIAVLAAQLELIESEVVKGERKFNIAEYSTGANTLRRLLQDIGLERRQRDVTLDLDSYLARASKGAAE